MHTYNVCGNSAEFRNVTINGTYGYHLAFKMLPGLVGIPFL